MKHSFKPRLAVALMIGLTVAAPAFAQRNDRDRDRHDDRRDDNRWRRGERLPQAYRGDRYVISDWGRYGLHRPSRGERWVYVDGAYVLAGNGWMIAEVVPVRYAAPRGDEDRERLWRNRYSRAYTFDDDPAYTECRNKVDPAGVAIGAILGGVLGNAASGRHDGAGPTIAGVIAGGAIGAALTQKLDCNDRQYAYRTYTTGFNAGKVNTTYDWRNPQNGHRGQFHVLDYYYDEDRFRCSVYSNTIWIDGRPEEARGRACQQPDGSWAIID